MNPSNTSNPSSTCRNAARTEICGIQKWEPQNGNQLICNAKNCQIYGGHDWLAQEEYPCPARRVKAKDPSKNSLGSPVGMVASNINFKTEGKPADIGLARYATYLKAFVRLHLNPETMWTAALLDEMVREGLALYSNSEKSESRLESPADIYTESERRLQREFEMSGCQFQVELMGKFKLNSSAAAETDGKGDGTQDISLRDLKATLSGFFRRHKHCLLLMGAAVYTMIWRTRDAFFVLDVCGRSLRDFRSDRDNGVAMLLCLKTLENVRHLLIDRTNLSKLQSCTLRELKLVKVRMPAGRVLQRDYRLRVHQYEVVNDDYAYLKASLHLTLNRSDLLRNRSALPAAVAAMVVSKIDHPATWNMRMVDTILCFGVKLCRGCWVKCEAGDDIDVQEFPTHFHVGQFRLNIEVMPRKYEGTWRCVPGSNYSEMSQAIEKAFEVGDQKLLLQINQQFYAIWRQQSFIYLLDPYRHRILGKADEPEIYEQMEKSATIRMFRSFEVFMNTFNHVLLDSNRTTHFSIHSVKIKNIQLSGKAPEEEAHIDVDGEVKSLNEHVCFDESDELCQKALADISDYEDADLLSDVDELELKTSSSEDEETLEEEEAAASGEEEDMQRLETTSSSEEDDKKRGKENKVKRVGRKSGKAGRGRQTGKKGQSKREANERKKAGGAVEDEKTTMEVENKYEPKGKHEEDIEKKMTDEGEEPEKSLPNKLAKNHDDGKVVEETEKRLTEGKGSKDKNRNRGKQEENKIKLIEENKDKNRNGGKQEENKNRLIEESKGNEDRNRNEGKRKETKNRLIDKDDQREENKILSADKDKQDTEEKTKKSEQSKASEVENKDIKSENDKIKYAQHHHPMKRSPHHLKVCDGSEADDEHEEDATRFCRAPRANRYPGYYRCPLDMAVVGSENGSYESLCQLLQAGFRLADRLLAMTHWGNFVVFRCMQSQHYFLFDGCTCNVNRFRHLDLTIGTAGLLCFRQLHDVVQYMRRMRSPSDPGNCRRESLTVEEICRQYCG